MATSLEESEKTGLDQENSRKYLPCGEKIVKIGPVDTEIALLLVKKYGKKEEISEGKIYSPFGKFAERAKLEKAWQSLVYSPLGAVLSRPSEYL